MPDNWLSKKQWIKLSIFFLSISLTYFGVINNRPEFALIAVILVTYLFFSNKYPSIEEAIWERTDINEKSPDQIIFFYSLIIYAILTGIFATYIAFTYPVSRWSAVFWVIAIILFILAGIVYDRPHPIIWLQNFKTLDIEYRRRLIIEILLITLITVIAFVLRFINLEYFPPMFHGDEGEFGLQALRVLGKGDPLAPFAIGLHLHPNLFFFFQAGSMAIFGQSVFGLRMLSVIFGTACVPLLYLIGRKFWGKLAGFSSAWLLTVSHFNIQYSRLALNNIQSTFFMILFILFFLLAFFPVISGHTQKNTAPKEPNQNLSHTRIYMTSIIAAGLTLGLAQYMYSGSRLIPVVAIPLFFYLFLRKKIKFNHILLVLFSAFVVYAPLGYNYIQHPEQLIGRMNTVSIFNPQNIINNYGAGVTWPKNAAEILFQQFNRNINFFLQTDDHSPFYWRDFPALDPLTALLFWLGLGVVLGRLKRLPEIAIICWFSLGFLIAGVITNDSPYGPRLLIISPLIYLVSGIFIQRIWNEFDTFVHQIPGVHISPTWLSAPLFCGLLAFTLVINVYDYFYIFIPSDINTLHTSLAREISSDAVSDHVYLMGEGKIYANYGTIRFIAGEGKVSDLKSPEEFPRMVSDGKGVTILAVGPNIESLKRIKALYPEGVWSDHKNSLGSLLYSKYRIPPFSQ